MKLCYKLSVLVFCFTLTKGAFVFAGETTLKSRIEENLIAIKRSVVMEQALMQTANDKLAGENSFLARENERLRKVIGNKKPCVKKEKTARPPAPPEQKRTVQLAAKKARLNKILQTHKQELFNPQNIPSQNINPQKPKNSGFIYRKTE